MGWFPVDILSTFPFQLLMPESNINQFARLAKLPKIIRLFTLTRLIRVLRLVKARQKYVDTVSSYIKIKPSIERIFTTFGLSFIIFHIVACIWHLTTVYDSEDIENWKFRLGYNDDGVWDLYLTSFYWTIQTVVTVGYGDIPAVTDTEKFVAISWMFVGVFVYSFLIGSISSIFFALDSTKVETRKRQEILAKIHSKYSIPSKLLRQIKNSLKNTGGSIINEDIQTFLKELPKKYQVLLGYEMYKGILSKVKFFQNKSKELIAFVGPKLTKVVIEEKECVYHKKEVADDMLFIESGKLAIVAEDFKNAKILEFGEGYYVGETDLLFNNYIRKYSVMTTARSTVFVLKRNDFKAMMTLFKSELEEFTKEAARRDKNL